MKDECPKGEEAYYHASADAFTAPTPQAAPHTTTTVI